MFKMVRENKKWVDCSNEEKNWN